LIANSTRLPTNTFNKSIERAPGNAAAYVQLGNLRMAQSQYAEAQKAFQQGLEQDPEFL